MQSIKQKFHNFILFCKYEKNLNDKTIKAYEADFKQFLKFIEKLNITTVSLIDKNTIRQYLQILSDLKPKTIKRKIATLKSWFNFMEFEDYISTNPFRKMKISIKENFALPKTMDIDEVYKILNYMYRTEKKKSENQNSFQYKAIVRDLSIIEMLFGTGMRVSEVCNLKKNDINFSTGEILINGKGNKQRLILLGNPEVLFMLRKYRKLFDKDIRSSNYFFINRLHQKMSEQSVRFMIKQNAQAAGIKRNITPHMFRHTFATLLLEENVDIKYIQHLLGHSSIMTTQIYTHVNKKKQDQILKSFHPRNTIELMNKG